ncbi:metal-dependent hydrolase [Halobacteriales archaeon QH_6_68_27]|nr:MAG: metal-dependent hydrolase [Halobacteriales archaeon QH_6_68_27]
MWPWGHLAAGYLVYTAYTRLHIGDPPADVPALVALLGTQLPDLVDKPLAWSLAVLPTGRSLGHSLVVGAVVLPVAWALAARRDARPLAAALSVGWLSHLLGDALYPLVDGEFAHVAFLAWPLLPLPAYEVEASFAAHFALLSPSPTLAFELALVALASLAWHADGYPGLATVRSLSERGEPRTE